MRPSGRVAVLGSANADLVVEVERRPHGGETLMGSDLQMHAGGKGANQAAAAAWAGAQASFIGCLGPDAHAVLLRGSLADAGVDIAAVHTSPRPTGTALIFVTPDGENSIVVSPGANHAADASLFDQNRAAWERADALVVSMEIPYQTVRHAVARAAESGVRVVLNAAPAHALDADTLRHCDPLIVNQHEACAALGLDDTDDYELVARQLLAAGVRSAVITLGADGAVTATPAGITRTPAYAVTAVDTTGAGDAFVGATAAELARGVALADAVGFATAMSAIAVQRVGAQSSYPSRAEVEEFIREHE